MTRLAVFTALYVLPTLGALGCLLYESWHHPRWRSLALLSALDCHATPGCAPGPSYHSAGVEVSLLRVFLSLVVGISSGMWVWSGKTCRSWSSLFTAPRKTNRPVPMTRV
ncbi:frizzled-8-like [Lycorma delicatula]|uniref:frizzled-8-like n=1 Tax=Lycorma delicatula TaxID=130591 RepID=UPI003F5118E0